MKNIKITLKRILEDKKSGEITLNEMQEKVSKIGTYLYFHVCFGMYELGVKIEGKQIIINC